MGNLLVWSTSLQWTPVSLVLKINENLSSNNPLAIYWFVNLVPHTVYISVTDYRMHSTHICRVISCSLVVVGIAVLLHYCRLFFYPLTNDPSSLSSTMQCSSADSLHQSVCVAEYVCYNQQRYVILHIMYESHPESQVKLVGCLYDIFQGFNQTRLVVNED